MGRHVQLVWLRGETSQTLTRIYLVRPRGSPQRVEFGNRITPSPVDGFTSPARYQQLDGDYEGFTGDFNGDGHDDTLWLTA
jgi:hypothetical protein